MPGGNGMGPVGQGQGRGRGRGQGLGIGLGRGNRSGAVIEGLCVCPNCGEQIPHQRGVPCNSSKCPKCATVMIRG